MTKIAQEAFLPSDKGFTAVAADGAQARAADGQMAGDSDSFAHDADAPNMQYDDVSLEDDFARQANGVHDATWTMPQELSAPADRNGDQVVRRRPPRAPNAQPVATNPISPPADLLSERAILSSCIIDGQNIALAQSHLRPSDFYDKRHEYIFEAAAQLATNGQQTEPISLYTQLELAGHAAQVGLTYLIELADLVGSTLSLEFYAKRVAKLAIVRRILSATHKLHAEGYRQGVDPDAFVGLVETEIQLALQDSVRGGAVPLGEVVREVYDEILKARQRGGEVLGISTGYRDLDKLTQGLHATNLFILAARPAMGKTAFALNMALDIALKQRREQHERGSMQHGVLIFSLEMGREELVQRLLSTRGRIGLTQLRKGELSPDDEIALRDASAELSELRLFIDDTPAITAVDVRARAKRMQMNGPLDLIVVDYLQLMRGTGGAKQSREQEISEISRNLKAIAKELHCCVMALSQLNRGVEQRQDKRPMMSDLRESGAIEQDADVIAFIYRDVVYNKDSPEHTAELIIAKQRAGSIGTVGLHFEGRLVKFSNLDTQINDNYAGY